jgi:hypothetical protein
MKFTSIAAFLRLTDMLRAFSKLINVQGAKTKHLLLLLQVAKVSRTMDVKTYLKETDRALAEAVAARAGTTYDYLIQLAGQHRKPSPDLARKLVKASRGKLTLGELRPDLWSDSPGKPAKSEAAA